MSTQPSTVRARSAYAFIRAHRDRYSVQSMCPVLGVAPSGYDEWLQQPISRRAQEDARLLRFIRASFVASHGIYGAPRVFLDLRKAGEVCSKHRVARLMREATLRALHEYRTRHWAVGKPSVLIANRLQRPFTTTRPNKARVTDITYLRTWQGWLYLAVVMDLLSRMIVGWAARPTIHGELVLNAVAKSFFSSLKNERIKKQICKNRELAIVDVADDIDTFYNRTRRHSHLGGLSPEQVEAAHRWR